jgi:hypothetical protein
MCGVGRLVGCLYEFCHRINRELEWWSDRDLNPEPRACEARDLPLIYHPMGSEAICVEVFVYYPLHGTLMLGYCACA